MKKNKTVNLSLLYPTDMVNFNRYQLI